jgi:exopolysaccharide production protein ExoQ
MPSILALLICVAFVLYLFRCDTKSSVSSSSALWLPLAWVFFAGSRFPSRWLSAFGVETPFGSEADGSPLDRAVFFLLIVAGLFVLRSRPVDGKRLLLKNKWVWLYFGFGIVSVVWSVDPAVSLRRVAKAFGNVVMALVVVTEVSRSQALAVLLRRLAYLTLPMSIVFIRYFPDLGRSYSSLGFQQITGVASQKNSLGTLCVFASVYCIWSLLYKPSAPVRLIFGRIRAEWILLPIIAYLIVLASSATSLVCLVVASTLLVFGSHAWIRTPRRIAAITIVSALSVAVAEYAGGVSTIVIDALGRRADLTTRVPMWEEILRTAPGNPLLGVGFEAYWLTDIAAFILKQWPVGNAHNGYLDTYMSSGYIGLLLLVASIGAATMRIARQPSSEYSSAVICLCLLVVVILHNWTESAFRSVSAEWTMFFIAGMDVRMRHAGVQDRLQAIADPKLVRTRPAMRRTRA